MLSTEQETGLRLRGEHGIMRKKFDALHKDIEEQKEENRLLDEHKKDLYQVRSWRQAGLRIKRGALSREQGSHTLKPLAG